MKNSKTRIIGGTQVTGRELPWQVALYMTDAQGKGTICGGSVVTTKHVVTAAHCTDKVVKVEVLAGFDDRSAGYDKIRKVKKWTNHPKYNTRTMDNDVAVVELVDEMPFNDAISPICLPDVDASYAGKTSITSGFGLTSDFKQAGAAISNHLLKIVRTVAEPSYCVAQWKPFYFNTAVKMCANHTPTKTACSGDSGGPLAVKVGDNYHLVGVVSYGHRDGCTSKYPGVFARVQAYVKWITDVVTAGGSKFCPR